MGTPRSILLVLGLIRVSLEIGFGRGSAGIIASGRVIFVCRRQGFFWLIRLGLWFGSHRNHGHRYQSTSA